MTDIPYSKQNDLSDQTSRESEASAAPPPGFQTIHFTGTAKAYFSIWITNLILTLLTLGIYDAWAKVKRINYFYNNTFIRGDNFIYHVTGGQILIGRIVVVIVLLIIGVIQEALPLISPVISFVLLFVVPVLLNRSLRFKARMTSWRNVRLDWHGTYWKTFYFFVIGPILGLLTLGTLLPYFSKKYYSYYASHHSLGTTGFKESSEVKSYYWAFLSGAIVPFVAIILLFACLFFALSVIGYAILPASQLLFQFLPFMLIILYFVISLIYTTLCRNIMVQTLKLGEDAEFNSSLNPWRWVWISLSNFVVVIFTLGLMTPWAAVRRYRYLSDNTHYHLLTDEHQFMDKKREEMSAFGQEFTDFEGWEISI